MTLSMQTSYRKLAQMADESSANNSFLIRGGMIGDNPRRLVGHDISADQIAFKPTENNLHWFRVDMSGDDPRLLVGHDVPYSSL